MRRLEARRKTSPANRKEWRVVTITPDTTLPDAHRLMDEKRIRRLPVLKDGQLVGIVT